MEPELLLDAIRAEGGRIAEVAGSADLSSPVPACPGWTIENLVGHLGGVYRWVAEVLERGEGFDRRTAPPPPAGAEVVPWFAQAHHLVVDSLASRDPDGHAWVFRRNAPQKVGWWYRRQAVESALHRHDVEVAAGLPAHPVDAAVAVEGIDEVLTEILPAEHARGRTPGLSGTLHLHATDHPGEWWVDFDAATPVAEHRHAKADTAVRGPASGLVLWLWNRDTPAGAGLEVFGGDGAVAALRDLRF